MRRLNGRGISIRTRDAEPRDAMRRHIADRRSGEDDAPRSMRKWPVMTLMSVDLPEPFGPTSPRILARAHIERDALERLNAAEGLPHVAAFEHRCAGLACGQLRRRAKPARSGSRQHRQRHEAARRERAPPAQQAGHDAIRQQQNDKDEPQRDPAARQRGLGPAGKAVERDGDDDRAERRPQPMARAAEDAHHHRIHDHRDLEGLADGYIADIDRIDAADRAGDARGQREARRACSGRSARPSPRRRLRRRGSRRGRAPCASDRPTRRTASESAAKIRPRE